MLIVYKDLWIPYIMVRGNQRLNLCVFYQIIQFGKQYIFVKQSMTDSRDLLNTDGLGENIEALLSQKEESIDILKSPRAQDMRKFRDLTQNMDLKEEDSLNEVLQNSLQQVPQFLDLNEGVSQDRQLYFQSPNYGENQLRRQSNHFLPIAMRMNPSEMEPSDLFEEEEEENGKISDEYGEAFVERKIRMDSNSQKKNVRETKNGGIKTPKKGLKVLSRHCKQILEEKKNSTYKQVADNLTSQIFDGIPLKLEDEKQREKQKSNVKRRVYDALNVFRAMGILKKEDKGITYVEKGSTLKYQEELLKKQMIISNKLKQIRRIELQLQKKKSHLNDLQLIKVKSSLLRQRNQFLQEERDEAFSKLEKIQFPFVVFSLQELNQIKTEKVLQGENMKNIVFLNCQGKYSFQGDLESIVKLDFDQVEPIKKEVRKKEEEEQSN